ncbi:MAG: hypothetical protein ACHQU1_00120 [Gemmatimonadales bacterium]
MTLRALVACLAGAAAVLPGTAAAQSFVAQPQHYMLTTDAYDARAVWLQPAGLSRLREASFAGFATADASGGLSQYGVTLASGGLGLGWQHDRKVGTGTDVFTVGFAVGGPRAGLGADHRWYKGSGAHDGSWDLGARMSPLPMLDLSLVWRDMGSPVSYVDTLGTPHTINSTLVPAAALNLFGRLRVGAEWEIVTNNWGTSAIRLGASTRLVGGLALSVRGDFSSKFDGRAVALALTWNGPNARSTAFASRVRGGTDHFGGYVAGVRDLAQVRRGSFR